MLVSMAALAYVSAKSLRLRGNTLEGYESALRLHVLPRWAATDIESIDPRDIQRWVDGFERPGAAEKAYKTLRQVVRWAMRHYRLRIWDPTSHGVELPRKAAYRPRVLDARELKAMLRGLWGHVPPAVEAVAIIGSCLGARRGEACAVDLARSVDWRTGEVALGPSLQVVRGRLAVLPPKTPKSERVGVLPSFALRRLRQLFPRHMRRGLASQGMRPDEVARALRSACRRLRLPHVPPKQLRHTWATLAVEAGVSIETVAMMLGHTGIGMAYEHYIVSRRSICREAQRRVEALLVAA